MKDIDRAIAERAVALGLLDQGTLESYRKLVDDRRSQGDRVYLSQLLVRERVIKPADLVRLQDDIAAPVYECPSCGQKHPAPDVGKGGEKFACKGCGKKVRLLERDRTLTQVEVLSAKDPRELTIPLRLASETGSATQVGQVDLDRYQVEGELGRGGYGVVFKARHKDLDRPVALKVIRATQDLDATILERFVREGRAASRLSHPNICHVYDIGRYKDLFALAMELVPGRSLRDLLLEGPLDWRRACEVQRGILAGIQHAHENGVIHRDLKPANVIIEDGSGRPRIIDFGLAKDTAVRTELTDAGLILGTPYYLAPEQVEGRSHQVDARSDVFALGTIFYEALTGERPFAAKVRSGVYQQILEKDPVPPSQVRDSLPRALDAVCARALRKKPEERFQSAKEFSDAIEAAVGAAVDEETAGKTTSKSRARPREAKRSETRKTEARKTESRKTAARRVPSEPAVASAGGRGSGLTVGVVVGITAVALVAGWALRGSTEAPRPSESEGPVAVASPSPRPAPSRTPAVSASPAPVAVESPAPRPSPEASLAPAPTPTPDDSPAPVADATPAPDATPEPSPAAEPSPPPLDAGPAGDPNDPAAIAARDDGHNDAREFPGLSEKSQKDWVARAFATNFHAQPTGAGAGAADVRALRFALLDQVPLVRAFALRGLALRPAEDLRAWGGRALVEALIACLRAQKDDPYLPRTARLVLKTLAGSDQGTKEDAWRAWWKDQGLASFERAARERASAPAPTDQALGRGASPAPGASPAAGSSGDTQTREREVTRYMTETRELGLDCVLLVDVTDSMTDKLARVRREIGQLTSFFSLLVPKKGRLGLVTFGDYVKDVVPLTDNMRTYATEIEQKAVLWHDPLDKTVEEGPDKALARCFDVKSDLGWRKGPRRVLVLITDAPMHKEDVKDCYAAVEKASGLGWTLNTVACEPPAKYAVKWPPWDQLKELAHLGKGISVELKDPKELMTRLLTLTLGAKYEEDLRRFVTAYRDVTGASSD